MPSVRIIYSLKLPTNAYLFTEYRLRSQLRFRKKVATGLAQLHLSSETTIIIFAFDSRRTNRRHPDLQQQRYSEQQLTAKVAQRCDLGDASSSCI